jgi:hypothetical protein
MIKPLPLEVAITEPTESPSSITNKGVREFYYTYTISDNPGDVLITYARKMEISVFLGGLTKVILFDGKL